MRTAPRRAVIADLRHGSPNTPPSPIHPIIRKIGRNPHALASCRHNEPGESLPEHVLSSLATARPHEILPRGMIDLLLADPRLSPPPGVPTEEPGPRNNPWFVLQWCTQVRVRSLLVLTEPTFMEWGPQTSIGPTGTQGGFFQSWLKGLQDIGFRTAYQPRVHLYGEDQPPHLVLMGRSDRKPLTWPEHLDTDAPLTPFLHSLLSS